MKPVIELQNMGYVFSLAGDQIVYRSSQSEFNQDRARILLLEIKEHKNEALAFINRLLQEARNDSSEYILMAYCGELEYPVLLPTLPEYKKFFGASVWLCPDEKSRSRVSAKDNNLALTVGEFFILVGIVAEFGEKAISIIEARRMFFDERCNTQE